MRKLAKAGKAKERKTKFKILRALLKNQRGLNVDEIIGQTDIKDRRTVNKHLESLKQESFVREINLGGPIRYGITKEGIDWHNDRIPEVTDTPWEEPRGFVFGRENEGEIFNTIGTVDVNADFLKNYDIRQIEGRMEKLQEDLSKIFPKKYQGQTPYTEVDLTLHIQRNSSLE